MSLNPSLSPTRRPRRRVRHRAVSLVGRRSFGPGGGRFVRAFPDIVIGLLVFLVSLNINLGAVPTQGFHPDETRWLNRSHYIRDVLNPFGPAWQDYYLTRGQPPMGSYLMGIGQLVQGKTLYPNLVWDFFFDSNDPVFVSDDRNERWNQVSGAMPSRENLLAGRRTNAFTGALAVLVAYIVGRLLTNRVGGVIGALVLSIHPLHVLIASQALSDQLLILLLGLSCIAGYQVMKRPSWGKALLLGVLLGLGGATKLTPMLLSLPVAMMGAFFVIRSRFWKQSRISSEKDWNLGTKLVVQPILAFAAFVLVYPYLWVDPIGRTYNLFKFRVDEMASQAQLFDHAGVANVGVGLARTGDRLAVKHQAASEVFGWFNDRLGTSLSLAGLDLMLGFAGLLLFVLLVVRKGLRAPETMIAALLLAETATIIYGLRSDLYRYFLPLVFVQSICISVLAGALWATIFAPRLRAVAERISFDRFLLQADAGRVGVGEPDVQPVPRELVQKPVRARQHRPTFTSSHAD